MTRSTCYLGDVKQPQEVRRGGILGVEGGTREDGVPVPACDHEGLHAHVRAQDDLRTRAVSTERAHEQLE